MNDNYLTSDQSNQLLSEHKRALAFKIPMGLKIKSLLSNTSLTMIYVIVFATFIATMLFVFFIDYYLISLLLYLIATALLVILPFCFEKDLKARNIQSITDPNKFIKQYLNCITNYRSNYVFHTISPKGLSSKTAPIITFMSTESSGYEFDIRTINEFSAYWDYYFGSDSKYIRHAVVTSIKTLENYPDKVIYQITIRISCKEKTLSFLAAIIPGGEIVNFISGKHTLITIRKTIFLLNNIWYVAEGEIQGPLDFATFKN